ncbi:MAG: hypothetical protein ACREI7_12280, partial [Myxococcota bacterium]
MEAAAGRGAWRGGLDMDEDAALEVLMAAGATGAFDADRYRSYEGFEGAHPPGIVISHAERAALAPDDVEELRVLVNASRFDALEPEYASSDIVDGCTYDYGAWVNGTYAHVRGIDDSGPPELDAVRERLREMHDGVPGKHPPEDAGATEEDDPEPCAEREPIARERPPQPDGDAAELPAEDQPFLILSKPPEGPQPYASGRIQIQYANGTLVDLYVSQHRAPKPYWPYECPPMMSLHGARAALADANRTGAFDLTVLGWPDPDEGDGSRSGVHVNHAEREAVADADLEALRILVERADLPSLEREYCCPPVDGTSWRLVGWSDGAYWHVRLSGPDTPEALRE